MEALRSVWLFIQDQVLGMKWLHAVIGNGLSTLGLDTASRWGGSVHFFFYDVIKITVLLCLLIFLISYIQSFFPPERSKRILGRFRGIWANIIAALLGTVTPFCSCSSIPLFIGFTSAGLPLGVTFSFLISSPMVDLGSLVLLMSIFGVKVAIVYVIVGLIIAVVGGTIIEKLHMENYVEEFIRRAKGSIDIDAPDLTVKDRLTYAREQVVGTFKKFFRIFSLESESVLSFITGFLKSGFRTSLEVTIPSGWCWLYWSVFPCMRTFLERFLLRKHCWLRVHCLVLF